MIAAWTPWPVEYRIVHGPCPTAGTWATNNSRTDTTIVILYGPVATTHLPYYDELKVEFDLAERYADRKAEFRSFLKQLGKPPGPGSPAPTHATCSRRRFRHRRSQRRNRDWRTKP